jgi:plasmid stabilization system protein ParE
VNVYLLPEAEADLEAIGDRITIDNPKRAVTFVNELYDKCMRLANMPFAFALAPRYAEQGVRYRVHGKYQIFYVIVGDRVEVLRILHSARDISAILFPGDQ